MNIASATKTVMAKPVQAGFGFVKDQTEAVTELQKDLLLTCEEIGEGWASRLRTEAVLWSNLMGNLAAARSTPEFFGAYSDCLSQRLQMAGDDTRRLTDDYQRMTQKFANALNNGLQPWRALMPWLARLDETPPSQEAPSRKSRKRRPS
jgi:hypothetical protein